MNRITVVEYDELYFHYFKHHRIIPFSSVAEYNNYKQKQLKKYGHWTPYKVYVNHRLIIDHSNEY